MSPNFGSFARPRKSAAATALLFCLIFLSLTAGGCHKLQIFPDSGSSRPDSSAPPPQEVKRTPLDEARLAYSSGDYSRAEALALRLVEGKSLAGEESAEAGRILAAAALNNAHPNVALQGLDHWRAVSKGADGGKEWQDAWCRALRDLSTLDARTKANALYQDSSRDLLPRSIAGVFLAARQWKDGELGQSMAALENIYSTANSAKDKAAIEGRLAVELNREGAKAAELAASAVTEENRKRFPYNIIYLDQLRRMARNSISREEAARSLAEFRSQAQLADSSLFDSLPRESNLQISAPSSLGAGAAVSGQPVVLALPMGGQYGKLSARIVNGAQTACEEMSSGGGKVQLIVIDTDKADWLDKVNSLPAEATVIGGPLRRADYQKAKAAGVTSKRVMLAFLPSLDSGDEGRVAWRFFSSANDQVDAVLGFTSGLGVSAYGVLYPADSFGERMAALFEAKAKSKGASKVFKSSYDPQNQTGWTTSVSNLLTAAKGSPMKAIFLPDSWKNMDALVPNLFYYKETGQILLGTTLWEQGLAGGSYVSGQHYNLAVFPAVWNSVDPPAAGRNLQAKLSAAGKGDADFWAGLGYDFARVAGRMGLRPGWTPGGVNSALASASAMNWSIAPISWSNGVAAQRMFLFSPKDNGFGPVNEAAFKSASQTASAQ